MRKIFTFLLICVLVVFIYSGISAAGSGWLLWEKQNNNSWSIVDGYPTYEACTRIQQGCIKKLLQTKGVRAVGNAAEINGGILNTTSAKGEDSQMIFQYYCLPSDFHPRSEE